MSKRRLRAFRAGEHVGDEVTCPRRKHAAPVPRNHRVGGNELHQRHLHVPDRHAKAELLVAAGNVLETKRTQTVPERRHAHALEHLDERDVQRKDERVAHGDESPVLRVEVGGTVPPERHGHIAEALVRRHHAALQRARDEERLERGACRTRSEGRVDLSARAVEVVTAARKREHVAGRGLHHNGRHGIPTLLGGGVHRTLAAFLHVGVEGRGEVAAVPLRIKRLHRPVAEVRGLERTRRTTENRLHRPRRLLLFVRDHLKRDHAPEHIVASRDGAVVVSVGAVARRCLHHPREERGLAEAEFLRALPEPALRSGLHAHEVCAERRAVEVLRDDPLLRLAPLHLHRQHGLLPLPPERLRMRRDEAHGLHRDRRGAGDAPSAEHVLERGAEGAQGTDPAVRPERTVLGRDERLDDPVRPVGRVVRPTVHVTRPQRDAQDIPGGVPQDGAAGIVLRARVGPVKDEPGCGQECGERAEQDGTCPQRSGPAERNRPPKPRAQDSGTWLHVPSPA